MALRRSMNVGMVTLPLTKRANVEAPAREARVNFIAFLMFLVPLGTGIWMTALDESPWPLLVGLTIGVTLMQAPKVAKQWERAVVLRLGKYVGLRGPGLFWIIPFVESVTRWIDQRVITTSFAAEETLTSDTVPVNVDAVLFWLVYDPEKAALEVQEYVQAVSWAAQTALRDIIGRTSLTDLLKGRERIEEELQKLIDTRSNPWGVTVQSVEMRDVVIPDSLQDAMSREAQASREKQARVILGQAEVEIAHSFAKAAESYRNNPTALHLRAMNMLYEAIKERGSMVIVPSSAVETMGLGGMMATASLGGVKAT
jgi:regulator of protease activity HflC (stomatin/prohibitin superfamily)